MVIRSGRSFETLKYFSLYLLAFLIPLLNAKGYFYVLSIGFFSKTLTLIMVALMGIISCSIVLRRSHKNVPAVKYVIPILIIFLLKYVLLFIQSPDSFFGRGIAEKLAVAGSSTAAGLYLEEAYYLFMSLTIMFIVVHWVDSFQVFSNVVFYLLLGSFVGPMIVIIAFPDEIGMRSISLAGIGMTGGVWNSSLISFITVFWLFVAADRFFQKIKRISGRLMLIVVVFGSLAGLSRSFYIAAIFSLFVYLLLLQNFKKKIFFMILVILGGVIFCLCFPAVVDAILIRFNQTEIGRESRLDVWQDYLSNLSQYWISGVWKDGFRHFSVEELGPHSIFLNYLVRFGVLGLLVFLWLLFGILKAVSLVRRRFPSHFSAAVAAWLGAYLAMVSYNETGFLTVSFYASMALVLALGQIAEENVS